jgi:CheY-like chemotaxis protein
MEKIMKPMPEGPFILVIDDKAEEAELTCHALSRISKPMPIQQVNGFQSTIDFITRLEENHAPLPALVVCDLKMPGGGGFDVLRWIRGSKSCAKIPFVIITGALEPINWNTALALGATSFIYKTAMVTDPDTFIRTIDQCLALEA